MPEIRVSSVSRAAAYYEQCLGLRWDWGVEGLGQITMLLTRQSIVPLEFEGLRIFDYTAGRSGSSSMALIEVEPGARHKEAWSRRSDKYYLVLGGEISFVLEGAEHLMSAGDFCIVERGRRFSYANRSASLATLVLVHTPRFDLADEVFVEP